MAGTIEGATTKDAPSSWDDGDELLDRELHLEPETVVGRFVIEHQLGEGGMGVVYAARDRELERRVAIKLVRAPLLGTPRHERAQRRMLREAQAMARVNHPNVTTVYEVGLYGERVFIAMELVDGQTVRDWLAAGERSWREIRDVFVAAGRGLAAAHDAGVVHRDFKPSNVLVTDDDRILVTDFGLAIDVADPEVDEADSDADEPPTPRITRTGAMLGTPAYMAPEQLEPTGPLDARTDQYAFCVSMYEALLGEHPFGGGDLDERLSRMRDDEPTPLGRGATVPTRVSAALSRGMRSDPDQRFDDLDALLAELSFDPRHRRRVIAAAAVAGIAAASIGVLAYMQVTETEQPAVSCEVDTTTVPSVWDEAVKKRVFDGLAASGAAHSAAIYKRVEGAVGRYIEEHGEMARESCEATRVRGDQPERVFDLRARCLERRLDDVRGLTAMLTDPTEAIADKAIEASLSMTPIRACADITALRAPVALPEDPNKRADVETVQRQLAAARALSQAGQYQPALDAAAELVPAAESAGHPPLHAEVLQLVGDMQARTGAKDKAVETLRRAAVVAEGSGHDDLVARVRIGLVHVAGYMLASYEDGALWSELAEASIERLGTRGDLRGYLELSRGALAYRKADYEAAATHWQRAVDQLKLGLGPDHADVARALNNLGLVSSKLDRADAAVRHFETSLKLREKLLGPEHLLVANTLTNLGGHHRRHGDYDAARRTYERAADIREANDPHSPRTAGLIMSLAMVHMDAGDYDKSLTQLRRAQAIYESSEEKRKGDLDYAHILATIGNVEREQGELDKARSSYQRAIEILKAGGDTEHERAGAIYVGMGMTLSEQGDQAGAIEFFNRSVKPWEAMSPEHLNLGYPLTGIGVAHLRAKRPRRAVAVLERALAIRTKHQGRPENLAETEFALARALWDGGDRQRARQLGEGALVRFTEVGLPVEKRAERVRVWLAERPVEP